MTKKATHVVTSTTYGLGAIFNFMRIEQSGTYNTSVEASLKVQHYMQFNVSHLHIKADNIFC